MLRNSTAGIVGKVLTAEGPFETEYPGAFYWWIDMEIERVAEGSLDRVIWGEPSTLPRLTEGESLRFIFWVDNEETAAMSKDLSARAGSDTSVMVVLVGTTMEGEGVWTQRRTAVLENGSLLFPGGTRCTEDVIADLAHLAEATERKADVELLLDLQEEILRHIEVDETRDTRSVGPLEELAFGRYP